MRSGTTFGAADAFCWPAAVKSATHRNKTKGTIEQGLLFMDSPQREISNDHSARARQDFLDRLATRAPQCNSHTVNTRHRSCWSLARKGFRYANKFALETLPSAASAELPFFISGLLYLLCFGHVDNLGACRIPS